jgi:hypothetical protein
LKGYYLNYSKIEENPPRDFLIEGMWVDGIGEVLHG